MPRLCTVCTHSEREEIDSILLSSNESFRNIAERFSLSSTSVYRHKSHLNGSLIKAKEAEEVTQADNLLDQVRDLQTRALNILTKIEQAEDWRAAPGAIREARGCLELLGRLAGELKEGQKVNIIFSPQGMEITAVILNSLDPYPEARIAVTRALSEFSTG